MKNKRERTARIPAGIHKNAVFHACRSQSGHAEEPGPAAKAGVLEYSNILRKSRPFLLARPD